jgi:GT2 family glycosyltransferase
MEKGNYRVTIIVPNYNGREHLAGLLPSISNQTFDDYEVIIIDDFSPDSSVLEYIKTFIKDHENMRLVENTENMGFVRTCNKGIRLASGDYVCLLNNDTEVKSDFVERNVEIMDADSSIGVLSCIIVDKDGNNLFSGGSLKRGVPVYLRDDFEGVRSVDFVAGTACFCRREVFDKIGLLDEHYFMYHDDIEFCLRVGTKTDYKVCMFPEKLVTHYTDYTAPSLSRSKYYYYLSRNLILVSRKYSPKYLYMPKILLLHIPRQIINLLIRLRFSPQSFLLSLHIIRGALDGIIKRQDG